MTLAGSTNAEYHANRTHLSSSQLKMLLKDPKEFYETYILNNGPIQEEKAAFTEGSFVHTLILEPHKVVTDYAIFNGLRKAGAAYEEFKAANPGKTIISAAQVMRCERLFQSFKAHEAAVALVSGGLPEESMTATLQGVACKARADYIVPGKYILDVKTTAMPTDTDLFRQTVAQYSYDLSAALYKRIADANLDDHDFYWLVLSKSDYQCKLYKASAVTLAAGAIQVSKALELYKTCSESNNWSLTELKLVTPTYEVEEI